MTLDGLVIAGLAFSITLFVVSLAALGIVALKIQEDRRGTGCHGGGCRRSRSANGCTKSRTAEPGRGETNWRE